MVASIIKDMLGGIGGVILAICLVPQLWKMWRTQSADDLSMPFILLYTVGNLCTNGHQDLIQQLQVLKARHNFSGCSSPALKFLILPYHTSNEAVTVHVCLALQVYDEVSEHFLLVTWPFEAQANLQNVVPMVPHPLGRFRSLLRSY